tara:strand:+ start:1276 stop:1566 length:291 start_codon:yes stop_codon:yes gene_type:complete
MPGSRAETSIEDERAMTDPRHRDMMAAQAPRSGATRPTDEAKTLLDAVRRAYGNEPVMVIDGDGYVKLPVCDSCEYFRWDKAKRRWFHDRDCTKAK